MADQITLTELDSGSEGSSETVLSYEGDDQTAARETAESLVRQRVHGTAIAKGMYWRDISDDIPEPIPGNRTKVYQLMYAGGSWTRFNIHWSRH